MSNCIHWFGDKCSLFKIDHCVKKICKCKEYVNEDIVTGEEDETPFGIELDGGSDIDNQ